MRARGVGSNDPLLSRVRGVAGRLLGGLCVDLGGDHRDAVFLAGGGRGGTTWVSEIVNHRGEYRYIFEPFNPGKVGICWTFRRKQYLRPEDRREEYLGPARTILSGRLRSGWADRFNRKIVARRRLIKDIRANLLLGWLAANFSGMPIVLLLRHPCAVVASRLGLGWRDNLAETMEQRDLVEDFLLPFEAEIRGAKTAFERHVFLWCIENYVPLRQFASGEIHLAFYETLLARPEEEIPRLFSYLDGDFDEGVYRTMKRPSSLSRGGSEARADGWRHRVSGPQLERTIEILGLFGLDRVYGEGAMPDPEGVRVLAGERGSAGGAG